MSNYERESNTTWERGAIDNYHHNNNNNNDNERAKNTNAQSKNSAGKRRSNNDNVFGLAYHAVSDNAFGHLVPCNFGHQPGFPHEQYFM
jgi:hypothetical protein